MAYAVTHILVVIIILDLLRHYVFGKEKFPRYLVVIGGLAGLLPDIDIPIGWLLSLFSGRIIDIHGLFTHSILFVILFLILAAIFHYQDNPKWRNIFAVISIGWFFHLFLDCFYGGLTVETKYFLWPLKVMPYFCPTWNIYNYAASIDAIILIVWLVHEELHKHIRRYV